jgi:Ni/Co efflux regulator RcnB
MRKLLVPTVLVLSMAIGSSALAAPKAAKPAPAAAATSSKASDCARQWTAQKKHTETRKAFLTACEKA